MKQNPLRAHGPRNSISVIISAVEEMCITVLPLPLRVCKTLNTCIHEYIRKDTHARVSDYLAEISFICMKVYIIPVMDRTRLLY